MQQESLRVCGRYIIVIGTILLAARAVADDFIYDVTDHQPGMSLAKGYETMDGSVRGDCVVYESTRPAKNLTGQSKTWKLREVSNSQQFYEQIDLSVSAAYKSLFASAKGKASFLRENVVNQYSLSFVATSTVENTGATIVTPRLSPEAEDRVRNDPEAFRQQCGNAFVLGVTTGGEFYGYVSIKTSSSEDKTKLATELSGQTAAFEADANFEDDFQKKLSKYERTVKGFELGGSDTIPLTIESMLAKMKTFPQDVRESNVPYKVVLQDYRALPNFPSKKERSPNARVMAKLVDIGWQYKSLVDDIVYVNNKKEQFLLYKDDHERLRQLKKAVQLGLDNIETAVEACFGKTPCNMPNFTTADDYREQLPLRFRGLCVQKSLTIEKLYVPVHNHTRGDDEMAGHNPKITIMANLNVEDSRLLLTGDITMEEDRKDWTTFTGNFNEIIFDLPIDAPHCVFANVDIVKPKSGELIVNAGKNNHKETDYTGKGLIKIANCLSDTKGRDSGKLECKAVTFQPVAIAIDHEENLLDKKERERRKMDQLSKHNEIDRRIDTEKHESMKLILKAVKP